MSQNFGILNEIAATLGDCPSILIVGPELDECGLHLLNKDGYFSDLGSRKLSRAASSFLASVNKVDRIRWQNLGNQAENYDCIIAFYDETPHRYDEFIEQIKILSSRASERLAVVIKNGHIALDMNSHKSENDENTSSMVDRLRALGFRVCGMSGPRQLRNSMGGFRIIPDVMGKWAIKLLQQLTWNHPRQSYRLYGVMNPRENIKDYYKSMRREIMDRIPSKVNRVLDVGCGAGFFGEALKEERGIEVWGIEYLEDAAAIADRKLDKVIVGDANTVILGLPENHFDCIVFNDVLEHLVDPYSVLSNAKNLLTKNGIVLASIPNVRHVSVMKELLLKRDWPYRGYGVLDKTHLRFFTKKSIVRMFSDAGYACQQIVGINSNFTFHYILLNALLMGSMLDSRFMQYACIATPNHKAKYPEG